MKIALICSSGKYFGNGHLYRCEILNKYLKKYFSTELINIDDKNFSKNIFLKLSKKLKKLNPNLIIVDISSSSIIKKYRNLKHDLNLFIKKEKFKIIILDSIGKEKVYQNSKKVIRIIPFYVNTKSEKSNFDFLVINNNFFKKYKKNKINKKIKILITFGGHDIQNSILALKALAKLKIKNFILKIIIGKFCSKSEVIKIKNAVKNIEFQNIKFYSDINDITNFINWANVVICNDGMTKYEVAVSGRMAIIIRQNLNNYHYGKSYEKLDIAKYIDYKTKSSSKLFARKLESILDNKNLILKVSEKAKQKFKKNNIKNYLKLIKTI